MKLRQWQAKCIDLALAQYVSGKRHFLTLATPGSGKTVMASELANQLLQKNLIDLVVCFSPSSIVAKDFSECLHSRTQERFDGLIGAKGRSITYQNLQYLDTDFWYLFERYRVFVIFDEIHHCAGSNIDNANAWGEQIILNIQGKAIFTLALTGTPWRSDAAPVVLSNYLFPSNKISCDYTYGLAEAIKDDACRIPKIIAVDNNNISVIGDKETKTFTSFKSLLSDSGVSYRGVIENEAVIKYIISSANNKLIRLRKVNSDAGGLIVASSIEHAINISILIKTCFNEDSIVVTYRENEPANIIQQFRHSNSKWIISVGMISEGTNIPRLQVCCHLTNIKTEIHFRQILGRILRMTDSKNQEAILYMPAEPKLLEYAYRINQDIPIEADMVKFDKMKKIDSEGIEDKELSTVTFDKKKPTNHLIEFGLGGLDNFSGTIEQSDLFNVDDPVEKHFLTSSYEKVMNIYGQFRQESIALGLSELR
ncbi:DEAD/DEAH box helicase family protein [Pseudoalteromonas sp. SG45-5]|uniref:DEAD/DEAH box helicase n=1 Tax=unclassified Pseudoalteromonas TaxID=194690 RepID=UPI0015FB8C14|nr:MULTISPECIES: DEAD/DEAH box helicase family protein [unclassified Pseudoalteromonas]MBB1386461.1 DEAD/DEAH box helicase family protein [Pseudoalteromonas sp. SG45-5]MBB1394501.1 DEAD/DEAH box helicase family protein [Pseudoalteromonas sp. SG44-4]MBB1446913.1 DEAD/DEAH box helicase family protein [Pseudoalteromonas sp. SG41-6]